MLAQGEVNVSIPPSRFNFYGMAGCGKTTIGVSALVDIFTGESRRPGMWIRIGQEGNSGLPVPDNMMKRFTVNQNDPHAMVTELTQFLIKLRTSSGQGHPPGVVVFDGLTELDIVLGYIYSLAPLESDKWGEWRYRQRIIQIIMQLLDAESLQCPVITTNRLAEFKKGIQNMRGETTGADPETQESRYFPQMNGWARYNISSYFDYMFFMESDTVQGEEVHRTYLRQTGDFQIKNAQSHKWPLLELPYYVDNASFDDILDLIEKAAAPVGGGSQLVVGPSKLTKSKKEK